VLKMLDLFSGIGGFSLAASWTNQIKTVAFCEIDPFCQKVLKKHWPDVPIFDDITRLRGDDIGTADIITGGFPCQPFSCAGQRKGKADDRYLWPEMLRVISEVRPSWIIGENVAGINSLFQYDSFSEMEGKEYLTPEDAKADFKGISERTGTNSLWVVLDDLEKIGYSVQTCIIPACAVNAPHRRDRVWIVAHRKCTGAGSDKGGIRDFPIGENRGQTTDCHAADTASIYVEGCERGQREMQFRGSSWGVPWIEVATRLCRVDDGLPRQVDRVNRLKALGNAIVPQVAYEIMKNIVEVEVTK